MALKYADWEGALYDSKALTISIISCTVIFGIIAITPIDELIELLAPILELIGYGGAIAEAVHAIYDFADFFNRVKNAQSEKALQEANIRSVFMDELYKQFEELVLDNTSNFSKQIEFIKKIQSEKNMKTIDFYFKLLKDKRNINLFCVLRSFFDKFGENGKIYLLEFLSKSDDKDLIAEAIMILSGYPYQCKEVLPYIHKYITDENDDLRYRCIISLGWIGDKNAFPLLYKCFQTENNMTNKGYTLSSMRQLYFRIPELKSNILEVYKEVMRSNPSQDIILIIGLCLQTLLRMKIGIVEDEKGIHSTDSIENIKEKIKKNLFFNDMDLLRSKKMDE